MDYMYCIAGLNESSCLAQQSGLKKIVHFIVEIEYLSFDCESTSIGDLCLAQNQMLDLDKCGRLVG